MLFAVCVLSHVVGLLVSVDVCLCCVIVFVVLVFDAVLVDVQCCVVVVCLLVCS